MKKYLEKNQKNPVRKEKTETSRAKEEQQKKSNINLPTNETSKSSSIKSADKLIGYFLENQSNQEIVQPDFLKKAKHRRLFRKLCKLKRKFEMKSIGMAKDQLFANGYSLYLKLYFLSKNVVMSMLV